MHRRKKSVGSNMRRRKTRREGAENVSPQQALPPTQDQRKGHGRRGLFSSSFPSLAIIMKVVVVVAMVVVTLVLFIQERADRIKRAEKEEQRAEKEEQRAEKEELHDTGRIMNYPNFPYERSSDVATLDFAPTHQRFLAAESLLALYPECTPCLYQLSEASFILQAFDEATEASGRLVELVPHNSLAKEMHARNKAAKAWFDEEALHQQKKILEMPDKSVHHRWAPLAEIPQELALLKPRSIVQDLQELWRSLKLDNAELAEELFEIMQRQWAVETGRVENLYTLSEVATTSLIRHGISVNAITSDPKRSKGIEEGTEDVGTIERILQDQKRVVEALAERAKLQELNITQHFLIQLQSAFTATARFTEQSIEGDDRKIKVLVRRGCFKNQPNSPVRQDGLHHQYCPFDRVDDEIKRLLDLTQEYNARGIAPEIFAAWFHHRFVQIHPFHDGNGRVARSITSLVLMKAGLLPFTVRLRDRQAYFAALERANEGNLVPFVDFIVQKQKETLLSSLSLVGTRASQFTAMFRNKFQEEKLADLNRYADEIQQEIVSFLEGVAKTVGGEIHSVGGGADANAGVRQNVSEIAYQMYGFEVPRDVQPKYVVWVNKQDESEFMMYYCILHLHPQNWGIYAVAGMLELDGRHVPVGDGQWFDFSSSALKSPDVVKVALRSWLQHLIGAAFVED